MSTVGTKAFVYAEIKFTRQELQDLIQYIVDLKAKPSQLWLNHWVVTVVDMHKRIGSDGTHVHGWFSEEDLEELLEIVSDDLEFSEGLIETLNDVRREQRKLNKPKSFWGKLWVA